MKQDGMCGLEHSNEWRSFCVGNMRARAHTHNFLEKGNPYLSCCVVNFFYFYKIIYKMELMPLSEN